ncbi:uncharacterized protein LOC117409148 [Acipenser ruthenus]|uniref:uncharacterized protein LOC117409148 n=1 Tax=Acipenser ruthenus TaxID=7906 RepID=UPI001560CB38|nr:uncharacterized protein LOC117409148 [Acipenser ruthenus]
MEKLSVYAFPSDSDEFLPLTPPPVRLCQAFRSSSRSVTAPAPSANLASTRRSARQERGPKRGSASQPLLQLHYKDWTTPKLLKVLFEKPIPIPVGGDRMSLFVTYCEALSAEPISPPPHLQASAVRPSSSATLSIPVPAAHTQDSAFAAKLPPAAQSTQPQHLPQSLTPPIPSSSSAPQVTFNQLQTLLQPIIDSQLALSARPDKLENPALAPPAFSSSTPAYTLGHGAWLAKADISDAFKVMPIHPSLRHLFRVCWADKFYFSTQLTFGCRSSPKIFDSLSEALCWILLNSYHVPFLLHLMDDFLLISPPSDPPAQAINQLKTLFSSVGVPLSQEKTIGPVNSLEFLGITLNTVKFEASLPLAKLQRLLSLINNFQISSFIKKRDLLSLLGHFNFAIRIIPQGRTFISRLLALSSTVKNMNSHVKISAEARKDIKMWISLLSNWNGLSLFYDDFISAPHDLALFTDASSIGFGGFLVPEWFSSTWPPEIQLLPLQKKSTALLEIYPIAVAAALWGHQWSRKSILFFSDNKPTVHIINKGRSSSPLIMRLLRRLIWSSVSLNFLIQARHLPGTHNNAADALSRLQVAKFRQLVPSASPNPLQTPQFHQLLLD